LLAFALPLGFGEGFNSVGRVFELLATKQLRDGQDLQARVRREREMSRRS